MKEKSNRVISIYEAAVWLVYAWLFKYSHYLENLKRYPKTHPIDHTTAPFFPMPEVGLYALAMTLYIIPFYKFIVPVFLRRRWYAGLFGIVLLYFWTVPKVSNWAVSGVFMQIYAGGDAHFFFEGEHQYHNWVLFRLGGEDFQIILTDLIAFLSIAFMRFALDNEQKKHLLERDNLVLQLESLKAQLHPHFLFNTLNSIYGMSLTGSPETPGFILRLSDMMRFILYDCQQSSVALEKDVEFAENYIAMERQRYPMADIKWSIDIPAGVEAMPIAPLLFIPFIENSFKHGSHRVNTDGYVHGSISVRSGELVFVIANDIFDTDRRSGQYGGVGIENVRKRLELYYPGKHSLAIHRDGRIFRVELKIQLDNNTMSKISRP